MPVVKTARNIYVWVICSLALTAVCDARADTARYFLDNVVLDDGTRMTGTFTWTYTAGDFSNGTGQFTALGIPHTVHDQTDLNITIDVGRTIEFTLAGNFDNDGVDITLVLTQALTPTTSSPLDLVLSKYDIGGNGFFAGLFLGGTITLDTSTEVVFEDGFEVR